MLLRSEQARGFAAAEVAAGRSPVPWEVEMFERDKAQVPEQGGNLNAFLGPGSRVAGKLVFEGPVLIEGQVEGEITARDTLTIGESAVVAAQITGTSIVINGRVTGDVTTSTRLEIRASARLSGSISTPSLVINEGGIFEGQCTMRSVESQHADKEKDHKVALVFKEEHTAEVPAIKDRHVELSK
jgi:cytoskeletal protein CcmA (bactofilin family)